MCGIVAVISRKHNPSPENVRRGLEILHHRGPDASRIWQSPDGSAVLGHTRLSILDLSAAGDQPLSNEDGSLHAIVNGEFYGFEAIRADLQARGYRFKTRSDSEIILHLYAEYGADCVHHLRGEYAFVIWDDRKKTLFAARDRFGIKPLFYSQQNGLLSFASEVKALHAAGIEAAWDKEGFLQTFAVGSGIAGHSQFRHISYVPPAHYVIATADNISFHRYWNFDFPVEPIADRYSDQEYKEQFYAVLDEAVRLRLRADVPIGCYLSGGLDSSAILGLMSRHSDAPVRAFTLGFDDDAYDESPMALETAKLTGADLSVTPITDASLADNFSDAVWHGETFFFNAHGVAKFILSSVVRKAGYKVVMTGEGSDEILAGYPHFRLDLSRSTGGGDAYQQELVNSNTVSRGLLLAEGEVEPIPSFMKRLGYVPAWMEAREASYQKIAGFFPSSFKTGPIYDRLLDDLDVPGQMTGRHVVNQSLYLWDRTTLPGYILSILADRMEMAHSVEGRVPFLDHRVVEFARSLPVRQKINDGTEKYLLREALRPLLTTTIYKRQKHPFLAPPTFLQSGGRLHQLLQDTLRGPALGKIPFLRHNAIIGILDKVPEMTVAQKASWEAPLTALLSACILGDRFRL